MEAWQPADPPGGRGTEEPTDLSQKFKAGVSRAQGWGGRGMDKDTAQLRTAVTCLWVPERESARS